MLHPAAGLFVFFAEPNPLGAFHNWPQFGILILVHGPKIASLNISPFIERELKVALRQHHGGYRHFTAYIVTGLAIFFLLLVSIFNFRPHDMGEVLFFIVGAYSLIEILGFAATASHVLSEERSNKTLGLLFSTGISPTEVLAGKLSALFIAPLSRLLTIMPCLLVAIIMRAITPQVCFATIITLLGLLALVTSVYLLCSLIFKEHTSGFFAGFGTLALLTGLLPLIDLLNRFFGSGRMDRFWMSLNPAAGPWLILQRPRSNADLAYIYQSISVSALLSLLFITASAFLLSRIWQDQVSGISFRPLGSFLDLVRARQKRLAAQLLEKNPYEWLIFRDFQPILVTWLMFTIAAVVWLLGFWHWGAAWLVPMNFWFTLILLGLLVRWMTNYLGARQISLDRSSGTLELLLTSPLTVGDIVAAQQTATQKYVRPFYAVIGSLHLLFFILGLLFHPMTEAARTNYILISALVALFGPWFNFQGHWGPFWIGLNTGRSMYALTTHLFGKMGRFTFFWMAFLAFRIKSIPNIPTGRFGETILIGCVVTGLFLWYIFYRFCWTTDWNASQKIRNLAILEMRAIAAEPVPEINDPRLEGWDHTKPLFNNSNEKEDETDIEAQDERSRQRILQRHSSPQAPT